MVFKGSKILLAGILLSTSLVVVATEKFVVTEQIIQNVKAQHGEQAGNRVATWKMLMEKEGHRKEEDKLTLVNRFFNQLEFQTDMAQWGKTDYWATPLEMLIMQGGDCEDFSLAKFFTLLALGVPESKLLITYVTALELNEAHMVLTYYKSPEVEPLILDNLIAEIKPSSERTDLLPIYSFNGLGLWKAKQAGVGRKIGDAIRINKWRDFNTRMLEGF